MKTSSKIPMFLLLWSWASATAWAAPPSVPEVSAAVQAIQQAADPSAAVAAYANGMAIDRADPRLNAAYVARMVDLGLPELAYHQAETLTSVQSNNGLAWGVLAYVNARRGQMPEAISAINLAGQFAPDSPFVERTAGEIIAWYDVKADKSKLPENARDGLAKIRGLLNQRPAFVAAYDTARKAYQSQASATEQPTGAAPTPAAPAPSEATQPGEATQSSVPPQSTDQVAPLGYAQPYAQTAPSPAYYYPGYNYPGYNDYYYDSGPGWVQPAPWWWWQPTGYFAGFNFVPFGGFVVFDHHDSFKHHGHHSHHGGKHHDGHSSHGNKHHDGHSSHGNNQVVWHGDRTGGTQFFGRPAQPNASLGQLARDSFLNAPTVARTGGNVAGMRSALPSTSRIAPAPGWPGSSGATLRQSPSTSRGSVVASPSTQGRTGVSPGNPSSIAGSANRWPGSGATLRQSPSTSRGSVVVSPSTQGRTVVIPGNRSSIAGSANRWPGSGAALRQSPSTSWGSSAAAPSMQRRAPLNSGNRMGAAPPAVRSWSGSPGGSWTATSPRSSWPGQSFRSAPSGSTPRMPMGGGSSPGSSFRGSGFGGGGPSPGAGFRGGGFSGGAPRGGAGGGAAHGAGPFGRGNR